MRETQEQTNRGLPSPANKLVIMSNKIKMPNGVILETHASGNRVSQTILRSDGKIQRRVNENHGPVTIEVGGVKSEWGKCTTDTLFEPEQ